MPKMYAFTGKKGSGKNTAANYLAELTDPNKGPVIQFAFADILKAIVRETFDISFSEEEELKRLKIKPFNGLTLREVYQRFGESIKSYFGKKVWADLTIKRLKEIIDDINSEIYICTDLRYPLEQTCLKKFCEDNGIELIVIKMVNLNLENSEDDNHISETYVDGIQADYTIAAHDIYQIKLQMEDIYE